MYAFSKKEHGNLFQYHPSYLALGNTPMTRRKRFCALLERAMKEWARLRWCGMSSSHGVGRNQKKKHYEEFIKLSESWLGIVNRPQRGPPFQISV